MRCTLAWIELANATLPMEGTVLCCAVLCATQCQTSVSHGSAVPHVPHMGGAGAHARAWCLHMAAACRWVGMVRLQGGVQWCMTVAGVMSVQCEELYNHST